MGVVLRPLDLEQDVDGITALMRRYGFRHADAEGMRRQLGVTGTQTRRTTVAVQEGGDDGGEGDQASAPGRVVGYADAFTQQGMTPGTFSLFLLVDPPARRRGTGGRLYAEALAFARAHGLRELRVPAWDDDPQSLAFATSRGFRVDYVIIASRLDITAIDERRSAGVAAAVCAAGLRLFSLAEVADTLAHRRRLYDLYRETWLDAPDGAGWVERMPDPDAFAAPLFRPDAAEGVLLAADGAAWIGFTHLIYGSDPRAAHQAMTGVRRTHRGRGVAQALKLS